MPEADAPPTIVAYALSSQIRLKGLSGSPCRVTVIAVPWNRRQSFVSMNNRS